MASVQATLDQINSALKSSGSHYAEYSCKTVSWDDVQRGTVGGGLSCWGANITDMRLWAKDGRSLFTVRGNNWNERLGKVNADQIAVVANDDGRGGGGTDLRPYTLRTVLKGPSRFGGYAGLTDALDLSNDDLDGEISVRFQTTFLPVRAEDGRAAIEFAPEAYNYNTRSDSCPRNLVVLCTTQGLAVQQDGAGAKKLFHHAKGADGTISRHWLEAESSDHKVGGSQNETEEERADALARGKATASVIGVAGMGTRFNVLMTVQIPLKNRGPPPLFPPPYGGAMAYSMTPPGAALGAPPPPPCGGAMTYYKYSKQPKTFGSSFDFGIPSVGDALYSGIQRAAASAKAVRSTFGKSSAARVSKGSFKDTWKGLTVKNPERHGEHITVTIVLYYVCSGGVPTDKEVKAAVDDLEDMYKSVESGRLADESFDFMKSELTVKDTQDIETKLKTQPPPMPRAPTNWNVFPTTE